MMKTIHNTKIIGIDHGYGNMKTANCCFPTGIAAYDHEPLFTADMLVYGGRYYLIGEGHKEFAPDKIKDEDYYVLTLAAIAKELNAENLTEAHIVVAAGLPLTWTSGQKADFRAYLMKNAEVEFVYKKTAYHIYIDDVRIYPQGYAAIASFATTLKGVNLIADIGNGTMNTLYMINGKPQQGKMFTEKFGTYQCTLAVHEAFMLTSPAMYFITIFTFSSGFSFSLSDITMLPPCLTVFYFTVSHRGSISEREWDCSFFVPGCAVREPPWRCSSHFFR